ncbi:MAG: pyruvate dehydrogenase (acetyl-transferring), homodimeric type, partial [Ketobacter sp.]|nr:pyruvate dehydrogenase (acetyl-transferring), homodimeric type [Ketobacter sp.]
QNYKAKGGTYTREHFFGENPELLEMVNDLTDDDVWRLNRGGHDSHKIYAAYHAATRHTGQPSVVLAKTVKGYGMGESGEALNISHQQKKMDEGSIRAFRNRFKVPVSNDDLAEMPYYHPGEDSVEVKYMQERRQALGGYLPQRRVKSTPLEVPTLQAFESLLKDTGEREISTTMTFVRALAIMLRDKNIAKRIVPIIADEARTFGMEGMFRQLGIFSSKGQLYTPVDSDQLMFYKEDTKGQILQEGISEAGAMSSWIAAATSYANSGSPMIPFFIFYSMFGFQRIGDLAWAAGDMRARGFLLGGTSGRTTLNGEGLQHEDGNSQVMSGLVPNCVSYDPTFSYELAVILHDGMRRMYQDEEDVYFYITMMNENYTHPGMPAGVEEGIRKGMYRFRAGMAGQHSVQLMGSGAILREVIAAAEILERDYSVSATVWSATSFTELQRDGIAAARYNRLNPDAEQRIPWVAQCLDGYEGPVVAATDYVRNFAEQIRPYLPQPDYTVLGTDGFGRSDTRENLRRFFEVDCNNVVYAALHALYGQGVLSVDDLLKARDKLGLDPAKPNPSKS